MEPVRYGIIGINGYGRSHLDAVERLEDEELTHLAGVAEIYPERCRDKLDKLRSRGVNIYEDYREMLDAQDDLEVVSVPTPIPLHIPMATACFEKGIHVMLEKPPAVLVQDVDRLIESANEADCLCQVGFQNIADECARQLRERIADGQLGSIQDVVVVGTWRRLDSYYARAGWAGKVNLGGDWVLDGPLNNPLLHYIHEALFLTGQTATTTDRPLRVRAELYRAHPIQGEDTVCARATLESGARLHTYLTLCASEQRLPSIEIFGENGTAWWQPGGFSMTAQDEESECEGDRGGTIDPIRNFVRVVRGEDEQISPLSMTRNVILHNNGCYLSSGQIKPVPKQLVHRYESDRSGEKGETATEISGLMDIIARASRERKLFSELGVAWARETPEVELNFDHFDPSELLAE
ncbi:MAG: Gfo/Idh/MocA family oxidoreductase [Planctomycetes bacterium]|nr:Gfo/Idh/MocA family oxidoreductase [Planctomycetota bacterium]